MKIFNSNDEEDQFDVKMIGDIHNIYKTESNKHLLIIGEKGIIIFDSKTSNRLIQANQYKFLKAFLN